MIFTIRINIQWIIQPKVFIELFFGQNNEFTDVSGRDKNFVKLDFVLTTTLPSLTLSMHLKWLRN